MDEDTIKVKWEGIEVRIRPRLPVDEYFWKLDGPRVSLFARTSGTPPARETHVVGSVWLDDVKQACWKAFDHTQSDPTGMTAALIGTRSDREAAKKLVEDQFNPPTPEGPNPDLKAKFIPPDSET